MSSIAPKGVALSTTETQRQCFTHIVCRMMIDTLRMLSCVEIDITTG